MTEKNDDVPVVIYTDNSGETWNKPSWAIPCGIIGAVIICASVFCTYLHFFGQNKKLVFFFKLPHQLNGQSISLLSWWFPVRVRNGVPGEKTFITFEKKVFSLFIGKK